MSEGPFRFDIITIFPDLFAGPLGHGIVRRARERGLIDVRVHDLRDHAHDRHRSVDDAPFGGEGGMVMRPEPLLEAVEALHAQAGGGRSPVLILSPQGDALDQHLVEELERSGRLILVCGRYEGIDERVRTLLAAREISIGDYVLSGGELPALIVVEAVTRLLPGALHSERSAEQDSFTTGLLDHPHYTRPAEVRGLRVPEVLLSGDHARILRHRRKEALYQTLRRRPDLLMRATLDEPDRALLDEIRSEIAPGDSRRI